MTIFVLFYVEIGYFCVIVDNGKHGERLAGGDVIIYQIEARRERHLMERMHTKMANCRRNAID